MATVTSVDLHTMVPSSRLQFPLDLEPQELSAPHQINQSGEGEVFSDNIPTSPPAMSSTQPAQHELHPTFSTTPTSASPHQHSVHYSRRHSSDGQCLSTCHQPVGAQCGIQKALESTHCSHGEVSGGCNTHEDVTFLGLHNHDPVRNGNTGLLSQAENSVATRNKAFLSPKASLLLTVFFTYYLISKNFIVHFYIMR
jgi:hypothetical protein